MNNQNGIDLYQKGFRTPVDTYNNSGKNVDDLKPHERTIVNSILKNEFL